MAATVMALVAGWYGMTRREVGPAGPMTIYATVNAQRANITLPDGSTVALNVATRLEVPADYLAGNRTVRLQGEALFTVRHRDGAPFTVIAGPSTTRVLGTSFVVRHYSMDTSATIAVHDGKVITRSTVVSAGEQVDVSARGTSAIRPMDPAQMSFASGTLALKQVPLSDAVVELNRWYNTRIRLGDSSLAQRRINGEFKSESLDTLADMLEWTLNLRVVHDGRVLVLYPRR